MNPRCIGATLLSLALAFGLAACGGDSSSPAAPQAAEEAPKGEALVDPCLIHPGTVNDLDDPNMDTSDYWYPEGDTSSEYFFFLVQTRRENSNIGMNITYCKQNGKGHLFANTALQATDDGHAKTEQPVRILEEDPVEFDLTFQDDFTCYDHITGTTWKRASRTLGCKDQSFYDDAFTDLVAYRKFSTDSQYIYFNADHTFTEQTVTNYKGEVTGEVTGTWQVKSPDLVWLVYDNPEDSGYQAVDVTESLGFEAEEGVEDKMQALDEIREAVWTQEFEIDESGAITAFGLTPVFNEDYSETIGYKGVFELTTRAEMDAAAQAEADAASAAKQAKADAAAAGSPYEQPEDKKDLSGVNLDQVPDYVMDNTQDYDTFHAFKDAKAKDQLKSLVVELHGTIGSYSTWREVEVQNASGSQTEKFTVTVVDGDADFTGQPEDGTQVKVVGVVWNDKRLYTDMAHLSAE